MDSDVKQLWKTCIGELQVSMSPAHFNTIRAQVRLERIEEGIAYFSVQNAFWQQQVEIKYYNLFKKLLKDRLKADLSLIFEIREEEAQSIDDLPLFTTQTPKEVAIVPDHIYRRARLVPFYTFDTFAVGSSNQMAFAAAEAVAQTPGQAYNPLFIWGGVGVGKTHLMQAIAHKLLQRNHELKTICCPGEEFTNEIVDAIRTKKTMAFKEKYRNMDLLMLDDVQFLAGKDTAQEEFFHTFNAIQRSGGQIVLTSDRPPSEIAKLEDRLRSRFEAGLIVDVANPDFELRTAIILIKTQQIGMDLSMEAAQAIAAKFEAAREMEGFLKHLQLLKFKGEDVSTERVQQMVGGAANEARMRKGVRPTDIMKATADMFGLKVTDLKGKRRQARVVRPRQIAMWLIRDELGLPHEEIGAMFGGRDHSTVMHSVQKIGEMLGKESGINEQIVGIKGMLT